MSEASLSHDRGPRQWGPVEGAEGLLRHGLLF